MRPIVPLLNKILVVGIALPVAVGEMLFYGKILSVYKQDPVCLLSAIASWSISHLELLLCLPCHEGSLQ